MAFTHHVLATETSGLKAHSQAAGWLVGVSGGLDSMVLLHALVQLAQSQQCPPLRVVHVNHGLHVDAQRWQQQVEQQAQNYGLNCDTQNVVIKTSIKQQVGIEAAARNARYQVFKEQLRAGEVLLLAQHADDQSETLLLRLLRGAGVSGLRAMPQQRRLGQGCLLRPLLQVRQKDLTGYAQKHGLLWCEDPSNKDTRFDRNFLRHQIMPLLRYRWPAMDRRLAITTGIMQDTQQLLDEVAVEDLSLLNEDFANSRHLPIGGLLALTRRRRHNVLRHWLALHNVLALSYAAMQKVDKEVLTSVDDAQPCLVLGDWCLRRNDGQLLLMEYNQQGLEYPHELWSATVTAEDLMSGVIKLNFGYLTQRNRLVAMGLAVDDQVVVRRRIGGERCKPAGRQHSQSLKKLLQDAKVPAWERQHLPLFYVNGKLAMVADLWINAGFEATYGQLAWGWQKPVKSAVFDCSN